MEALKQMILEQGKGIGSDIVKVDMFLNHRIDTKLLFAMGEAWAEEFRGEKSVRRLWGTRIKKFGDRWAPNVLEVETTGSGHRTKITVEKLT